MNKKLSLFYADFLACAVLLTGSVTVHAGIIEIGASKTYTTLAQGYAVANNGDTLLIDDGIYAGGLTVNKSVTFKAVNIGGAIVDGGGFNPDDAVFRVAADSTYFGLTVRNSLHGFYQRDNGAHGVIQHSVIYGVSEGVGINNSGGTSGSFDVVQSTFYGIATAVGMNDGGTINVTNSIIANVNTAYGAHNNIAINPDHNLLFNVGTVAGTTSSGHVSTDLAQIIGDPLFVNALGFDFRLTAGSPAIDSGKDIGLPFTGSAPDRGAFEFEAANAVPEPSSLILLGFGTLGLFGYGWRRSCQSNTQKEPSQERE